MGMEMSSKMSRRSHLLLFALFCGLCHSQYDDYGPPPDNPGGESGPGSGDVFGSGDSSSASGSGSLTTKAPSTTTKKPTGTTKAPTTLKPSSKTVVFPKLKSPIANYKFTKVFGVMAFAHKSVAEAKFQHLAFPKYFKMGSPSIDLKTKYKNIKSTLATLTDAARGGIPRVPSVPKGGKFPAKAYYTYRTASCQFDCNANEYWWWSTAAMTGLLKNRSEVKNEFKYYLPEVFKAKDPKMYALITDTTKGYKLPTRPQNGKYTGKRTCVSGPNVI